MNDELYEIETQNVGVGIDCHGLRSVYLPASRTVAVHYRTGNGIQDSQRVHRVANEAEGSAAKYLCESLCHVLNAGMEPDAVAELVENVLSLVDRTPVDYGLSLIPVGIELDGVGRPGYLFADTLGEQVVHVIPNIRTEILDVPDYAEWLKERTRVRV